MKKNTAKKGFTIVELVIVIAVIAILAAVLIPTFSSVISKANESAALQKANNALQVVTVEEMDKYHALAGTYYFVVEDGDKYVFEYDSASPKGLVKSSVTVDTAKGYTKIYADNTDISSITGLSVYQNPARSAS